MEGLRGHSRLAAGAVVALVLCVSITSAPAADLGATTARVAASDLYDAGRFQQFTFGRGYRELWSTPIEVPVLDLQNVGGGLTPVKRLGGNQTPVLAFKGADGGSYTFRGTDKDPVAVLHPDLQQTFVRGIVQDQMAAQHPGAPLMVGHLAEAAGVLAIHERAVVMPDDPALGEWRQEFAGLLGAFYEFPLPASETREGFHGALDIIGHEEMFERLEDDAAHQADALAFLRARLLDILIGDFDRHRKQWRWAKLPDDPQWQPIPEDRDMAFVRYEGWAVRLAHFYSRILQRYGPEYDDIFGLTLHGWEQDRWLLTGLEWAEWEQIATDVQARITDEVIDEAVALQPPEYTALDGERLRADLRGRRDQLLEGARKFYLHLANRVDVHTTDSPEVIRATRDDDGVTLEITASVEGGESRTSFKRRFLNDETSEVRVYLRSGADTVVTSGTRRRCKVLLRVIGAEEAEASGVIDDREGGGTRVYDSAQRYTIKPGPRTHIDRRPYTTPPSTAPRYLEADHIPPRDWGYDWYPLPQVGYERDVGVFLGAAAVFKTYGFRKHPWATMHTLSAGWAFEAEKPRVAYQGLFRQPNSDFVWQLEAKYSGIEVLGFYGFGNETSDSGSNSFFRARNEMSFFRPSIQTTVWTEALTASIGPFLQYSDTQSGSRFIDRVDPYGAGEFGMVGLRGNLRYDTRRTLPNPTGALVLGSQGQASGYPTDGILLDLTTSVSPDVWDAESWWGAVRGSASAYKSFGEKARVTLAGRIGAEHVWGTFPYMGSAFLGGGGTASGTVIGEGTIRGFRPQRFAGDQMLYGNLDVRVFLARIKLVFPGDFGVLGFVDTGRVWFKSESSNDWHWAGGGGVWFAPLFRTNAFNVTVGASEEETLVYFRSGFHF